MLQCVHDSTLQMVKLRDGCCRVHNTALVFKTDRWVLRAGVW
jgi:hypothetical protein